MEKQGSASSAIVPAREDSCIMQHSVLKASGHVDRFNDFMVKDVKASGHKVDFFGPSVNFSGQCLIPKRNPLAVSQMSLDRQQ